MRLNPELEPGPDNLANLDCHLIDFQTRPVSYFRQSMTLTVALPHCQRRHVRQTQFDIDSIGSVT